MFSTIQDQQSRELSQGPGLARRAKRLFPALLAVLTCTYAIAWLALFPAEYQQFGKHLAAGVKPENPPWVATSRPARATARDRCGEQEAKGEQSQESQKVRGNCGYQGAEDLLPIRRGRGRDDHDRKVAIASDVRFPREQLDS